MKKTILGLALALGLSAAAFASTPIGFPNASANSFSMSGGTSNTMMTGSGWKLGGSYNANQSFGGAAANNGIVQTQAGSQSTNLSGSIGEGSGSVASAGMAGGFGSSFGSFSGFSGF